MIEINLLPQELKNKRRKAEAFKMPDMQKLSGISPPAAIAGFFGFMVAVQLAVFGMSAYANNRLTTFRARHRSVMPLVGEIKKLKSTIGVLSKKIKAIDEIAGKRVLWSKKLNDLSDSVTPGIWLTKVYYDENLISSGEGKSGGAKSSRKRPKAAPGTDEKTLDRNLGITGYAHSKHEEATVSVTKFIESLKANESFNEDFSVIELGGSIQEAMVYDVEAMSFKINCKLEKDVR
ncbi:MAG: hypothetical protein ABIJ27_03165 [Candidatus Omnitrophota bacterium]